MRSAALLFALLATAAGAGPAATKPAAPPAPAPDPLTVANDNYRVVFENDQVRVLEHSLAVGGAEATHRMPCRVSYAMSGYKLVSQAPGAPRQETVRQPRTAWWSGAEEIALKNNGNALARELIVEFKQPLPGAPDCTTVGTLAVISVAPSGLAWTTDAATRIERASVFGDPARDGPFAQRVKLPAGFKSGKRAFDRELSATVLSGELKVSLGEASVSKIAVQTLPAGSYLRIPAGVVFEEASDRGVEYELRGVGPVTTLTSGQAPKAP
jgi:hypothetical protein